MFLKYPSLTNFYNVFKELKLTNKLDELFYATEKIHGSNMQIAMNRDEIRFFSRREEVFSDGDGLGKALHQASNLKRIIKIIKDYLKDNQDIVQLNLYGELYGSGIQKMEYKENVENIKQFRVFDLFVFKTEENYSLSLNELKELFGEELLVPIHSEVKTLKEWINSELSNESNLGGYTEGNVYKPLNGQELIFNAEGTAISNYLGVKHKTEEFAEKKNIKKVKEFFISEEDTDLQKELLNYFTIQRLDNLISKGFELSMKNLKNIIPEYLADVKKDFLEDNQEDVYFNQKVLNKMSKSVVNLVKEKLMNELKNL